MSDEELVIKTGTEQLFAPLQRLLDQLIGPAATEVGLSLSDSVKVWRFKRQLRLLQEVKRLVEDSGKQIKPIATRLFFPVLEAASIEDDDEMQTRWAALLANEATNVGSVHPCYIDVLKQLSPDDARLLDKVCDWCEQSGRRQLFTEHLTRPREIERILKSGGDSLDNLVRLGLFQSNYDLDTGLNRYGERRIPTDLESWWELSDFAVRFVRGCRAPSQRQGQIPAGAPE
jgi:hypothetical protein